MEQNVPARRTEDGTSFGAAAKAEENTIRVSNPQRLKLAFSKAADDRRISRMFDPDVKKQIDPENFVVKREPAIFHDAINNGRAAFFYDPDAEEDELDVHTLSMAYPIYRDKEDQAHGNPHNYTEVGTSLSCLKGYSSAKYVIAALTLKEWWENNPTDMIVTEILPSNRPSLHVYSQSLEWQEIACGDTTHELHDLCNENISAEDKGRPTVWFNAAGRTLRKSAEILLSTLQPGSTDLSGGTIRHKASGDEMEIDMSVLKDHGLSYERLVAISQGNLDRRALSRIGMAP